MPIHIRDFRPQDQAICEGILRALPEWFGIESSLVQYVKDTCSPQMSTWMAESGTNSEPVGFITLREHNARAAEIHCIAVRPEFHGQGVGRAMIEHAEHYLHARNFAYLQVKTLGPSRPDPHYDRTRGFYLAIGFLPLEEFPTLWPGNPCLQMVKKLW